MKNKFVKFLKKAERGQAIILIAFAFVGLVAMVGLVTDTGILLIEYGKLKRSVDAASIAAAQEYRPRANAAVLDIDRLENAAISILNLNQVQNLSNIQIHTCEPADAARPVLCNPDPVGNPMANRKLVSVTASSNVNFGFMRVIGINSVTLTASSIGEAATIDLVLVMDTSGGMAYQTGDENPATTGKPDPLSTSDYDDDPAACNASGADGYCEPMRVVKNVAWDFVSRLYFPYDRVSIVTLTSQTAGGTRNPMEVIPLTSDRGVIQHEIGMVKVFQPRECIYDMNGDTAVNLEDLDDAGEYSKTGSCLNYANAGSGDFQGEVCQVYQLQTDAVIEYVAAGGTLPSDTLAVPDPSSCPSSNIGGALKLARDALSGSGDPDTMRPSAFWVVVGLFGGGANATDPDEDGDYLNGFCPQNTWLVYPENQLPWCYDPNPLPRHTASDMMTYTNPVNGGESTFTLFDADDYARFWGDELATLTSGSGVTIYTIGLGAPIKNPAKDDGVLIPGAPPPAEDLLTYIAQDAGGSGINHGQYFFADNSTALSSIFEKIAQNIATKISQ